MRWALVQNILIVLPLLVYKPFGLKFGFKNPNFFQAQRQLLRELNRRIYWNHCVDLEGPLPKGAVSNCEGSGLYESYGQIRAYGAAKTPKLYKIGKPIPLSRASQLLSDRDVSSLTARRVYLVVDDGSNPLYLEYNYRAKPLRVGDSLMIAYPSGAKTIRDVVSD